MSNDKKQEKMKVSVKEIKEGMTIQYVGHHESYCEEEKKLGIKSVDCGSIKKSSPVVRVKSVNPQVQRFENLNSVIIETECGLLLDFSTRQKVIVK